MRCRLDIIADIIKVSENCKKTQLMYRSNMSVKQLKKYLPLLFENGLLTKNGDGEYQTTEKGKQYLIDYQRLMSHFV